MKAKRTAIAIVAAIFIWINVLTVLLSTYQYGYVDWAVVGRMGLFAFPPLAVAAVLMLRGARRVTKAATPRAAAGLGNVHNRPAAVGR